MASIMPPRSCGGSVGAAFGPEASDETLVKETAVNGDSDAFAELYRRYVSTVRGYLFKRIFDTESLDDLAQDAFVEALRTVNEYYEDPQGRVLGQWLCGCAGRALRRERWSRSTYKRAANVAIGIMIRGLRDEMTPWTADPSNANAEANRPTAVTDELREAIANLRPRYREAIELHYLEGLTLRKTAELMECTEAAVTYLVQCAADELRDPANARRVNDPMDKWVRLIQAARDVIDEVGIENATGTLIAQRAGLLQCHINQKFGTREGLIRAALGDRAPLEIRQVNGKGSGESRGKLLEAARQIVAEAGPEAAKAATIAERAGCSRRMITQNFGSLAELLKMVGAASAGAPDFRARILKAAIDLVAEGGVENASVRGIARRAECSRSSLFRHWGSLEALLAEVRRSGGEDR